VLHRHRHRERTDHHLAVSRSGLGATFHARTGGGAPEITWSYDPGVTETVRDSMTMARAVAELNAALGYPSGDDGAPRPTWMGSFLWVPPLPEPSPRDSGERVARLGRREPTRPDPVLRLGLVVRSDGMSLGRD